MDSNLSKLNSKPDDQLGRPRTGFETKRFRILVTGGAGFIGTHLVKALNDHGHEVTVLDLNSPELALDRVTYIQGDVRVQSDFAPLIPRMDAVYHLAAIVSVPDCQRDPVGSFNTNTNSTLAILAAIRAANDARPADQKIRMIFASSSAVYGDQGAPCLISETAPLSDPASFYGGQKLTSEQLIRLYVKNSALPATVFRFFNVYGRGQKSDSPYSGVISLFARRIREGKALKLHSGGAPTRDFVSVHDIVRGLIAALTSKNELVVSGAPINLGSGSAVTIRSLAETLFQIASQSPRLEDAPAREGDILHSCAEISRSENELGFIPQVTLHQGLRELWSSLGH